MFDAFLFTYIEMPFTGIEMASCVMEYARSQSNKTVQHAFLREFSKQSPAAMQIWTWRRKLKEEGCLCRRKGLDDQKHQKRGSSVLAKKSLGRKSMSPPFLQDWRSLSR